MRLAIRQSPRSRDLVGSCAKRTRSAPLLSSSYSFSLSLSFLGSIMSWVSAEEYISLCPDFAHPPIDGARNAVFRCCLCRTSGYHAATSPRVTGTVWKRQATRQRKGILPSPSCGETRHVYDRGNQTRWVHRGRADHSSTTRSDGASSSAKPRMIS